MMSAGLFRLLSTVKQPDLIEYLDGLPYDDLITFDPYADRFKSLFHVGKKYSLPLTEGSYKSLLQHLSDVLVHPEDRDRLVALMQTDTLGDRLKAAPVEGMLYDEFRLRLLDGGWRWTELVLLSGEVGGAYRLYFFDIQSRKDRDAGIAGEYFTGAENRNERTGLLKKAAFIRGAKELMDEHEAQWCFVAIDIENFKLFNDWYGHDTGNYLMIRIGEMLRSEREQLGGLAGYFGQDDFCLLIPYDMDRVRRIYDQIYALISENSGSGGFMPAFGVSLADGRTTVNNLLDRAFLAARYAKENYHSRIRIYEQPMYRKNEKEFRIISDFILALKNREITFYLQPQCRASSGKIVGAEALARWIRPDGSRINPDAFIPVLEKHGLISDLDYYIWEEVCLWLKSCLDRGLSVLPVSVNVSPIDLTGMDLVETFSKLIAKYDLPHSLLKIEITETAYFTNAAQVAETVQRLREKGFVVMMDDFGSGYSTLNMLRSLNVDVIKLDAHFISLKESDEIKGIRIIESVVNMAKKIGTPIIVEGVESEGQKRFLEDLGCRYIQGFYFYRPMDIASYEQLIADPDKLDLTGISFKANQQFRLRELLDNNVYSDAMLNQILGPCAFYARRGDDVDIVRFNEQFYRAAGDAQFSDKLKSIQQYMTPSQAQRFIGLFDAAEQDRLNGASGILRYFKEDGGTLTAFFLRLYYLHTDEDASGETKLFYGSVQDITKLTTLEWQMGMLSRHSPDTVVFLHLEPKPTFKVLFHGLKDEMNMDADAFERLLNSGGYIDTVSPENREKFYRSALGRIQARESFVTRIKFLADGGRTLDLIIYGDYIHDDTNRVDYIFTIRKIETADNI